MPKKSAAAAAKSEVIEPKAAPTQRSEAPEKPADISIDDIFGPGGLLENATPAIVYLMLARKLWKFSDPQG